MGYGGRFVDGAKEMEIVPFNQPETEEYMNKWVKYAETALQDKTVSAAGLIQALQERPQIAGLAQNPLLLSLICSLYQQDQLTLPARRGEIYARAVNYMLSEWNQSRPEFDGRRVETKKRLLEGLARHFTEQGKEVFDYADIYDWIEGYLGERGPDPGDLITELSETDGILQKLYNNKNDDQYLFLHRTLQEYFTAASLKRAIKKNKGNPDFIPELVDCYCWNYDWHETLILLAGLLDDPMPLLKEIQAKKDDIFGTQSLLSGRCIAECKTASDPSIQHILDRVYNIWESHPDIDYIDSVIVELARTKPYLLEVIQRSLKAIESLPEEKPESGYKENSQDINRRLDLLGKIGKEESVPDIQSVYHIASPEGQRHAIQALEDIGSLSAIKFLMTANNNDHYVGKRRRRAWGKAPTEEVLAQLNDKNNLNLDRFAGVQALSESKDQNAIGILISILHDKNELPDLRRRAAIGLGNFHTPEVCDNLILALSYEENIARNAASALREFISSREEGTTNTTPEIIQRSVNALLSGLKDPRDSVVESVITSLENCQEERVVELFLA
jgi:HEAT repeat protein